jgi:6-phosphogluconolactonase
MKQVTVFESRASLMSAVAAHIAAALKAGITERGEGFAALSGGSTPEPAYEQLARLNLDWPRVRFLLVDERFVPPTDPASNEAMLRRTLAPALSAGAKLLPMCADGVSLGEAAERADALYADTPIDIALMGMGNDGHTASWFSQSPQLAAALDAGNPNRVIAIDAIGAAGSPHRLTLTRSALARAKSIALLITGDEKRRLLLDDVRAPLPVDALFELPSQIRVLWAP